MGETDQGKQGKGDEDIEGPQEEDEDIDEPGNRPPREAGQIHSDTLGNEQDGGRVHGGSTRWSRDGVEVFWVVVSSMYGRGASLAGAERYRRLTQRSKC